jgi:hypothetical protein
VVLIGAGANSARQQRHKLNTWEPVRARVDSAVVATPATPRRAVYAPRYWVTYHLRGASVSAEATAPVYSGNYAAAIRVVERARAAGTIDALANPANPPELAVDAGYNARFFFTGLLLTALGVFFAGFGVLFYSLGGHRTGPAARTSIASPPAIAGVYIGALFGVTFAAAAILLLARSRQQERSWSLTRAQVDSADVVLASEERGRRTWAPRLWLTYARDDHAFHAPYVGEVSTSNYDAQAARAADAVRAARFDILLSPADPYRFQAAKQRFIGGLFGPLLFGLFSAGCFGLAALFWRVSRGETRRPRRKRS